MSVSCSWLGSLLVELEDEQANAVADPSVRVKALCLFQPLEGAGVDAAVFGHGVYPLGE